MYAAAELLDPELGKRATFSLTTASGANRVGIGIDKKGRPTAQLYKEMVSGAKLGPGGRHSVVIRVHSNREKPDEPFVQLGSPGKTPAKPKNWVVSNTKGSSAANLSRVVLDSDTDFAGFRNVRIAPTHEGLATSSKVVVAA